VSRPGDADDPTDTAGNTLMMLAAYNDRPSRVKPLAGTPNTIDTARTFQQTDLSAELEGNA